MKKYLFILFLSLVSSQAQTTNYLWSANNISNRLSAISWNNIPLKSAMYTSNQYISYIEAEDWGDPYYFSGRIKIPLIASVTNFVQWAVPNNVTQVNVKLHLFYYGTNNLTWTNEILPMYYSNGVGRVAYGVTNFTYSVTGTNLISTTTSVLFPVNSNLLKSVRLRWNYAPTNTYTNVWLVGIDQQWLGN